MKANEIARNVPVGNVVNLDMRRATEDSVTGIGPIGNVVNLLYSAETAGLIGRLEIGNVVNRIEAPANAKVHRGGLDLNRDVLRSSTEPLSAIVYGQLTIDADLSPEEIERGVSYLGVAGQVLYPEHLGAALEGKLHHFGGPMHVYDPSAKLVLGSLTLDEHYLRSLSDGTKLMVTGKLSAKEVLPNDLIVTKIAQIQIADGVVCRQENADVLLPRLERKSGQPRVTVIPAGYTLIERPLVLSAALLKALPARRLYCTEQIQIGEEVDTDSLNKALDALIARDLVLCPAALSPVLSKKLDILESDVIFYDGRLWLVDKGASLSSALLEHAEGQMTIVVLGALKVQPDVSPKLLADRVIKVHSRGLITGTADQLAILQFRLGIDEGDWVECSPEEGPPAEQPRKPDKGKPGIDNIINLEL